jgi:hypothetical protein
MKLITLFVLLSYAKACTIGDVREVTSGSSIGENNNDGTAWISREKDECGHAWVNDGSDVPSGCYYDTSYNPGKFVFNLYSSGGTDCSTTRSCYQKCVSANCETETSPFRLLSFWKIGVCLANKGYADVCGSMGNPSGFCGGDVPTAGGENYYVLPYIDWRSCQWEIPSDGHLDLSALDTGNLPMYIGNSAFRSCTSMTSVTLHPLTEVIGAYTFYLSGIETIHIPSNVRSIGTAAFWGSGLQNITFADGVSLTIGSSILYGAPITTVTIPARAHGLHGSALVGSGLTEVILPNRSPASAKFYSLFKSTDWSYASIPVVKGCSDLSSIVTENICDDPVQGCTDNNYVEYNEQANEDDGSCATLKQTGSGVSDANCSALKTAFNTKRCC